MSGPRRRIEVSRVVNAPPRKVFAFLTRPDNNRALDTRRMIRGSADHHRVTGAGAAIVMNMWVMTRGDDLGLARVATRHRLVATRKNFPAGSMRFVDRQPGWIIANKPTPTRTNPTASQKNSVRDAPGSSTVTHVGSLGSYQTSTVSPGRRCFPCPRAETFSIQFPSGAWNRTLV
jgi:hypothetical protein